MECGCAEVLLFSQSQSLITVATAYRSLVFECFASVQIDPSTGEVAGVFESIQPSDTDLGSKAPKDVKITGLWYGQLS